MARPKHKIILIGSSTYYVTKSTRGTFELRQKRFKERFLKGKEHPHDVVAVNTSKAGIMSMFKKYFSR